MTEQVRIFILLLAVNTIIACGYFLWGMIRSSESGQWKSYLFKAEVMFICPGIGPLFFFAGSFIYKLFYKQSADLEDVIFSKDRVTTYKRADLEAEGNLVPIEEALAVSDKNSQRSLLLKVVRGDIQNSLASISLALNSDDTETAHYAASVLQETLNEFRQNVQELYVHLKEDGEEAGEYAGMLLKYMNNVLSQNVFDELEQKKYVEMMGEAGEILYRKDRDRLTAQYVEWICLRFLQLGDFEKTEIWCRRSSEMYPGVLSTYTNQLKLYFTIQDKEKFFLVLNSLKKSDIVIDKDTLALIRAFYQTEKQEKPGVIAENVTEISSTEESPEVETRAVHRELRQNKEKQKMGKVTGKSNKWKYIGLGVFAGTVCLTIWMKRRKEG